MASTVFVVFRLEHYAASKLFLNQAIEELLQLIHATDAAETDGNAPYMQDKLYATLVPALQPTPSQDYSSSETQTTSTSDSIPSAKGVLDQVLQVFNSSLQETQFDYADWRMEDPDLMPTIEDFMLAWSLSTANGTRPPVWFGMDGDYFLRTFFVQPSYLRFALCAIAAHVHNPPLPEAVSFSLFQRARKAILRMAGCKPCVDMVKAYGYLVLFAIHKGQPAVGQNFLKLGLDVIRDLRLDVDPDDSPWLFHLNLTPRQKEDRRRAFWGLYGNYMADLGYNPDPSFECDISGDNVKPPGEVFDLGRPIFEDSVALKWVWKLSEILHRNRKSLLKPPQSLLKILDLDTSHGLIENVQIIISQCKYLLLYSSSPLEITYEDAERFKVQLANVSVRFLFHTYALNFLTLSCLSALHRPKLYTTSLKSCNPRFLSLKQHESILSATNQCLECAHRLTNIFFHTHEECMTYVGFSIFTQLIYNLFEACIICWFASCRMTVAWRALMNPAFVERERLLAMAKKLTEFMQRVVEVEGTKSGSTIVILRCMQAMVREMFIYRSGVVIEDSESRSGIDGLELRMTVMSLVGDDFETIEKEPYAYLGLLGLEVAGGVRWKGKYEPEWRIFWTSNT
ncbi:hypothetical protein HDU79_007633 [Rhizoclosmatium sp. JEL0117]|nr:hypothetical protein HDU79_007633 [Rhizoclosmatium sp. JEL0117]